MRDPCWLGKCVCELADGLWLSGCSVHVVDVTLTYCFYVFTEVQMSGGNCASWRTLVLFSFTVLIGKGNKQDISGRDIKGERVGTDEGWRCERNDLSLKCNRIFHRPRLFSFIRMLHTALMYFSLCIIFDKVLNVWWHSEFIDFGSNYCFLNTCFFIFPQVDA